MNARTRIKELWAPPAFANSELNGSRGIVLWEWADGCALYLLSGPETGREWQFSREHVREAPP